MLDISDIVCNYARLCLDISLKGYINACRQPQSAIGTYNVSMQIAKVFCYISKVPIVFSFFRCGTYLFLQRLNIGLIKYFATILVGEQNRFI